MRRKLSLLVALLVSGAGPVAACLRGQGVGLLLPAPPADLRSLLVDPRPTPEPLSLARRIEALEEAVNRGRAAGEDRLDLGILLVEQGRVVEGLPFLLHAEQECPSFATAASLASAFERLGNTSRAALWLRTARQREAPAAALEVERLHELLLRAEPAARGNFLNVDFGPGPLPVRPTGLAAEPAVLLRSLLALVPEHATHADLWLAIGEVASLAGEDRERLRAVYSRAAALGHPRGEVIRRRLETLEQQERDRRLRGLGPFILLGGLVALGTIFWVLFRARSRAV